MAQAPIGTPPPRPQVAAPPQDIVWDDEQPGRTPGPATAGIVWDPQPGQLFATPPPTTNLPKLPEKGPPSLLFDKVLPAAMEIGGAVLGAKGATTAVRGAGTAARYISGAFGAGVGGAVAGGAQDVASTVAAGQPPPNPNEIAGKFGERFTTNMAGEAAAPAFSAIGQVAAKAPVRKFGNFLRTRMSPESREAAQFVGGRVTPGQVSDSPFVQFIDNIAGATFGRGRYRKVFEDQEQQFIARAEEEIAKYGPKATRGEAGLALREGIVKDAANTGSARAEVAARRGAEMQQAAQVDATAALTGSERALARVSDQFGPALPTEVTGKASQSLLELAHRSAKEGANVLYDEVDRLGAGVKVSLDPLKQFVEAETARRGALATALRGGKTASMLKTVGREAIEEGADTTKNSAAREMAQQISAADVGSNAAHPAYLQALQNAGIDPTAVEASEVTFRQAHEIRSALGAILRDANRRGDNQARGVASQLRDAIDTSMKEAAGDGTPLAQAYTDATSAWKGMVQRFEEGALAKAIDAHPAEAVKALVGKVGAIDDVTLARETLGDEGWRMVQARVWQDIIAHPSGVRKTPAEILRELRSWSPQELKAVFNGAENLLDDVPAAVGRAQASGAMPKQIERETAKAIRGAQTAVTAAHKLKPFSLVESVIDAADKPEVEKLRALVGEEGWNKVVSTKLQRVFGREGEDATGIVTGKELARRLSSQAEKLDAVYGTDTANFLHQFTRHRLQLEKTNPMGSSGKMWLQLATPAAIAGVFTGSVKSAGAILLAPYVLARIATSPTMQRTLIGAMSASERAEHGTAARLTAQLLGYLVREKVVNPDGTERREDAAGGVQGAEGGPGALGAAPPVPAGRGPGPRGAGAGSPPVDPNGPPTPPAR